MTEGLRAPKTVYSFVGDPLVGSIFGVIFFKNPTLFNDFDYVLGPRPGTIHRSPDRKNSCPHAVMGQVDKAFDNGDDYAETVGYVPVKYRKTEGSKAAVWPDTSQTERHDVRCNQRQAGT